jgi:anti-sigma factor RsiW
MSRECERFRERIAALLDGECAVDDRSRAMEHVLACAGCLAEWEASKALRERLAGLVEEPFAEDRAALLRAAAPLLDELTPAEHTQSERRWWQVGLAAWAPRLAMAAVLTLVALLVVLWPREETRGLRSASVLTYHEYVSGTQQESYSVGTASFERGF